MRHPNSVTRVVISVLLLMATTTGCGGGNTSESLLPVVEVTDTSGATVSTATWKGTPLVINFWYSTCAPCAAELRYFAEVDADVDDVRFIGINPLDSTESMVDFAAERGVTYELFQDTVAKLQTELEVTSFPRTFFVTSDGVVVDSQGVLDASGLRAGIDELLAADQS